MENTETASLPENNEQDFAVITSQINAILAESKNSWMQLYTLMHQVQDHELYAPSFRSFTAWVNNLAAENKVHVSAIWARFKAGKVYEDYVARNNSEVPDSHSDLTDVNLSPDTINFVEKVAGANKELSDTLMRKVIAGDLTRQDLKQAYAAKKAEQVRREVIQDTTPEDPDASSGTKITAADIVLALSQDKGKFFKDEWSEKKFVTDKFKLFSEFPTETGSSSHVRRQDALIFENLSASQNYEIIIRGIEIKVDLHDLLSDHKMQEYTDFDDYFYIAIPDTEDMIETAQSIRMDSWGILAITKDGEIKVVEKATRHKGTMRDRTITNALLLSL